jgi:hypothetical protein
MNLVKTNNELSTVFNKYNIPKIDFLKKLIVVLPKNVNDILYKFLTNVELSKQHKYIGSVNIISYNIFDDIDSYNYLLDAVFYANKTINNSNISILSDNTNIWKIFIYANMMWELPFTLEDIIFIPYKLLKDASINNNNYKLINTLIHEKIHVLQRYNINKWINYVYAKDKNWIYYDSNTSLYKFITSYDIDKLMSEMIVKNPDTIYKNFIYVYKYKNNLYYGILYLTNNDIIKTQWFLIKKIVNNQYDKENISYSLEKSEEFILPQEHPFETYAYKIADDLTKS